MMSGLWGLALFCAAASALAAMAGVLWLSASSARALRRSLRTHVDNQSDDEETRFEFRGGELVAATESAREYLGLINRKGGSGHGVLAHLSQSFPGLRAAFLRAGRTGREVVPSFDLARSVRIEHSGGSTRLTVATAETETVTMDRGSHASLGSELETLRAMGDQLAYPTWRQTLDGTVVWANRAYLDLADSVAGTDAAAWPPAIVFPELVLDGTECDGVRVACQPPHGAPSWYECHVRSLDGDAFVTATPADALMKAERMLAEFTQTFSRTFAHLTVGIAVFGKDRELIMFNPALTDLTTLPVDLLLGRPQLDVFLDAMRVRQLMPEPKDYASWRQRVSAIETNAQDGTYSELWHLPGNRTFRMTGRPQIDGAFALLIEDISAEISLTRRFSAEIEAGKAILNALPDALAVFDRSGHLIQTNAAYDALWETGGADALTHLNAEDALRHWDAAATAAPIWAEVRTHLTAQPPAEGWSTDIQLLDGRAMQLSIAALEGGLRLVRFAQMTQPPRSRLVPLNAQDRVERLLKA